MPKLVSLLVLLFLVQILSAQQPRLVLPTGHTNYVLGAKFSPDGKRVVSSGMDGTVRIWNSETGQELLAMTGHKDFVYRAEYAPDGKRILSSGMDDTTRVWDAVTGIQLRSFPSDFMNKWSQYSPDGKWILHSSKEDELIIRNAENFSEAFRISMDAGSLEAFYFSPDGKQIVVSTLMQTLQVWELKTRQKVVEFKLGGWASRVCYAPNGRAVLATIDSSVFVWDIARKELLFSLPKQSDNINYASFTPDGQFVITTCKDSIKYWDVKTGAFIHSMATGLNDLESIDFARDGRFLLTYDRNAVVFDGKDLKTSVYMGHHSDFIVDVAIARDDKTVATASFDSTIKLWNIATGRLLATLRGHKAPIISVKFSADGKWLLSSSYDKTIRIWDVERQVVVDSTASTFNFPVGALFSPDSKQIIAIKDSQLIIKDAFSSTTIRQSFVVHGHLFAACISTDGKLVAGLEFDGHVTLWDAVSGKINYQIEAIPERYLPDFICFSQDGTELITSSNGSLSFWDIDNGSLLRKLRMHTQPVRCVQFAPDGKTFLTCSEDRTICIWNSKSLALISRLQGHLDEVRAARFTSDGKMIVSGSEDNTMSVWRVSDGKLIYSLLPVDRDDYLVFDAAGHYDGTQPARELLYFTCDDEVLELEQFKEKLWVPELADRVSKGESIKGATLASLDICGLTPLVERQENRGGYQFKIIPRRGKLGATILLINGIETRRWEPVQLQRSGTNYQLTLTKEELQIFFRRGESNSVEVRAYTATNDVSSRGIKLNDTSVLHTSRVPPNLYAVFIGVSAYKDPDLKLNFAAKDAADMERALSSSARKLLGAGHVFTYRIHTNPDRTAYPDKISISTAFEEIGKKAGPNDILLLFFAGHGIVQGTEKQFYFLTSEASRNNTTDKNLRESAISATELMEWMKPLRIKAQKRILILDACHSGQAINQIVGIGEKDQGYLAARNDDRTAEIRQIDRLNSKSGLYVLAASASDQSAYEMGKYNQGLLTYALLKLIKEQPAILEENKYLNVSGWFNAAQKLVREIVGKTGIRQEPQLVTTTNFNIGLVDKEVMAQILLPQEAPLFSTSSFANRATDDDELELTRLLNDQLIAASAQGPEMLNFVSATASPEAYILRGGYETKGDEVVVNVILKQGKNVRANFEVTGKMNNLAKLVTDILTRAIAALPARK
jgi:WD40 repeat protein